VKILPPQGRILADVWEQCAEKISAIKREKVAEVWSKSVSHNEELHNFHLSQLIFLE
jgi:hypothetical protein